MAEQNSGNQGSQNNSKQSGLSWSQPGGAAKPAQTGPASAPKSSPLLKPATPAPAAQSGNSRKTFLLLAGGVVVGGLLAWSWFSVMPAGTVTEGEGTLATGEEAGANGASTGGTVALPGTVIGNEALTVTTPQDAGLSVMVSEASVTVPTWVVVYESSNGVRGNALGAALFFPGGGAKTINLLRATTEGRVYLVGRHVDNGDKQFSLTNDQPAVNAAGNPVYVEFRTR